MRRLWLAVSVLILAFAASIELDACGDKFLRIGRSPRFRAYAAIHPASILVYVPGSTKPSIVKAFELELTRAGHHASSVTGMTALANALGAARYDIVVAVLPDAPAVKASVASVASRPAVLPLVSDLPKSSIPAIAREYGYLLKTGSPARDMLIEIDRMMKARLMGRP